MIASSATSWSVAGLILQLFTTAPTGVESLSFGLSRTHHAADETILVVATVTNNGTSTLKTWGLFDFHGGYKPTPATFDRWRAIRDSSIAAAPKPSFRCTYPSLPVYIVIPRAFTGTPLAEIVLALHESYSDTLRLGSPGPEYELWPGYLVVSGEFLMGTSPDTTGALRLGRRELRIALPVP